MRVDVHSGFLRDCQGTYNFFLEKRGGEGVCCRGEGVRNGSRGMAGNKHE